MDKTIVKEFEKIVVKNPPMSIVKDGFAISLDLTSLTELPENPMVKVFVWEAGVLKSIKAYVK